jgi:hypothetical protein
MALQHYNNRDCASSCRPSRSVTVIGDGHRHRFLFEIKADFTHHLDEISSDLVTMDERIERWTTARP